MSDIVERLRDTVQILATTQMNLSMEDWDLVSNAVLDAASAIKRLRDDNGELTRRETEAAAEIERLREVLREIKGLDDEPKCCGCGIGGYTSPPECCGDPERGIDRAQFIARAALEDRT